MDIKLHQIKIKDLFNGYQDNDEEGVVGYGGKLDIRPKYQREWVYDDKKRNAVIDTLLKGHPLNSIYWAVRKDGGYEVIDGQQRIISICRFLNNDFSIEGKYFKSFREQRDEILNYSLTVYFCTGTEKEKLEWFETINIAGVVLTPQELKNATFSGPWVTDAKKYFSKSGCLAFNIAADYLDGRRDRQEYLETAIKWISEDKIKEYMSKNQFKENANELRDYFTNVIEWVEKIFVNKRSKIMKGQPWGEFYNKFKDRKFDPQQIEEAVSYLIKYDGKIKLKGIYQFILTGDIKYLQERKFSDSIKMRVYEKQKKECNICKENFEIIEMEADHSRPWYDNGETIENNCQMLCRPCHYKKTDSQTKFLKTKLNII
ncbi:HNH endonuclease family protein [Candidatus Pelagibacter sp.]|uniref:HNH endonuclease family protein n=1 Tax=Candidatus Pelagibacter sp. TaxID=2024849 RepID=UPI003F847CF2|tara:strand:+ start:1677 stop:2795 length:1119 start_codon:yes stop_codon:yes gene_type:complete